MEAELLEHTEVTAAQADVAHHGEAAIDVAVESAVRVPARLLEYGWHKFVALPVHTALEIVEHPKLVDVPGAPYYALGMMAWQGRWLPVLDLCALLNAYRKPGTPPMRHALVVAYQTAPRAPLQYAAIATVALTRTAQVSDAQACPLPSDSDLWPLVSLACFTHEERPVPILDTGRLFSSLA